MGKRLDRPFGAIDKVGYMFGDFGCNMSFQLIGTYLMLFVTQGLGLSLASWAIIVMVAKIFDAINDPIIGAIVDARKPGKNGKFKPWIFWGSFAIAVTTILLFVDIRSLPYGSKFAYCLIMYMLWSVAYTAANVPYGSLNAVLTDDAGQRASLSSLRSIGAGLAMLPIMVIVPKIVYNADKSVKTEPFVWIALVCGLVGIVGFMMTVFMTKERRSEEVKKQKFSYFKTLGSFFKNRPILAICLASFAQLVFIMTYTITTPLVFQFYFKNTDIISISNILLMLPMMIFIPIMSKLIVKFGSKKISAIPNIVGIVVCAVMLCIPFPQTNGGAWAYMSLYMIAMLGGGTFMLATWSMVADCVDNQEIQSGKRDEASIYATYSLARKVAQGVGAGLVALLLSAVGYVTENMTQDEIVDYNSQLEISSGILKLSILLPLIGFIIVFIALAFIYNLDKNTTEANTELIKAMHASSDVDICITNVFYDDEKESNIR